MEVPEYNTICSTLFSCNAFPFLAACGNISSCEMLLQVARVICHQFHKDKTWIFCYFTTQNLEYYLWHSYCESNWKENMKLNRALFIWRTTLLCRFTSCLYFLHRGKWNKFLQSFLLQARSIISKKVQKYIELCKLNFIWRNIFWLKYVPCN